MPPVRYSAIQDASDKIFSHLATWHINRYKHTEYLITDSLQLQNL